VSEVFRDPLLSLSDFADNLNSSSKREKLHREFDSGRLANLTSEHNVATFGIAPSTISNCEGE
jgi:hypothetical protein